MDVTPGVDRVVHFSVRGYQFGFRRPSRRDQAAVTRMFAARLAGVTGLPLEAELHNAYGGTNLLWDCRLEVGLVPQRTRTGEQLNLGETAPSHWLEATPEGETVVSFTHVTPEEYDAVCAYLDEAVYKKKASSPPATSGSGVSEPTSEPAGPSGNSNPA